MQKAIVFGANGYLGRHIAHFLKQQEIEFIPTGSSEKSVDGYPNYKQIDVSNIAELQQLDFNVDFVFAFAGLTGTGSSPEIIERFTKVNELGLANVVTCCESAKVGRLIFPSTRLVYKGVENTPLKEDSEKEAKTIYAQNKIACEKLLAQSNVSYTIFRICVPYGNLIDTNYSYGTIGFFIGKASKGENITIYGDGSLKRTFSHVSDIVQVIFDSLSLSETVGQIYNIGSNDDLSLLEVAQLVAEKYGVSVEFVDWPESALSIESGDTIFDGSKLQQVTSYQYQDRLTDWLEKIG
ncbi:MAG: NAD(P)-dependent oxidoreductase [Vicingaceae bacterium]|nr:NAD(P)-dependent oxidoreductase [Vicingaceae bacterium]